MIALHPLRRRSRSRPTRDMLSWCVLSWASIMLMPRAARLLALSRPFLILARPWMHDTSLNTEACTCARHPLHRTKECARHMSSPTAFGMEGLKRIGRFLKHMPRVVQRFERQPPPRELVVYTDTNHAGCPVTRKTTSCSAVYHGYNCVQFTCAHRLSSLSRLVRVSGMVLCRALVLGWG